MANFQQPTPEVCHRFYLKSATKTFGMFNLKNYDGGELFKE